MCVNEILGEKKYGVIFIQVLDCVLSLQVNGEATGLGRQTLVVDNGGNC